MNKQQQSNDWWETLHESLQREYTRLLFGEKKSFRKLNSRQIIIIWEWAS